MGVLLKFQYDTGKYKIFHEDYSGIYKLFIIMALLATYRGKVLFDMLDMFNIDYSLEYNKDWIDGKSYDHMAYDYDDIKTICIYIK